MSGRNSKLKEFKFALNWLFVLRIRAQFKMLRCEIQESVAGRALKVDEKTCLSAIKSNKTSISARCGSDARFVENVKSEGFFLRRLSDRRIVVYIFHHLSIKVENTIERFAELVCNTQLWTSLVLKIHEEC